MWYIFNEQDKYNMRGNQPQSSSVVQQATVLWAKKRSWILRLSAEVSHKLSIPKYTGRTFLIRWLRCNAFSERDLWEYLTQEAVCRRLRRWAVTAHSFDRGCKALLDELRMRGTFAHWAKEASEEQAIVAAYRDQPEYRDIGSEHPGLLAEKHAAYGNVRIKGDARIWAEEAGFDGVEGLAEALRHSAIFNDVRDRISRQLKGLERTMEIDGDRANEMLAAVQLALLQESEEG
jgi:hypothetical protein